jgi:hypothetical protein
MVPVETQADPVDNPEGIRRNSGISPCMNGVVLDQLLPGNIETKSLCPFPRLTDTWMYFLFLRYWTPTKFALVAVSLIAINPMISFATFVTVLDSMAILFTFIFHMVLNGSPNRKSFETLLGGYRFRDRQFD